MTNLKTLKDLQKEYEWKFDTYNALRQEIIKWIKELQQFKSEHEKLVGENPSYNRGAINILKHIFNITDEELK